MTLFRLLAFSTLLGALSVAALSGQSTTGGTVWDESTVTVTNNVIIPSPKPPPPLPADFVFLGAGFNTSLPEQRAVGSFAWGHALRSNLYAFTRADILGVSAKPFAAQTVMTTGLCQITNQIGPKLFFGGCLDGGLAVAGSNTGGAIAADGLAGMRLDKSGHWAVVVMGGWVKTALSDSLNPVRAGVVYGWGK